MILSIIIFVPVTLVVCIVLLKNKKVRKLRREYEAALQLKDKKQAFKKGYEYYAALRGYHQITAQDELKLMKDIDSML